MTPHRGQKSSDPTATTIDLAFRFVEDAVAGSADLDQMPDQATVAFREILVDRGRTIFRLTASKAQGESRWQARITGSIHTADAPATVPSANGQQGASPSHLADVAGLQASGITAEAALDTLAAKIRTVIVAANHANDERMTSR